MQTQLDCADLTGACLTGAYIQDWNITTATNLDRVECEYIYMRLPTKENPDPYRKPDNNQEVFETGDFADFIKPIVETLDLYHNQGVDPRGIAISFKRLAENNPEAKLEIVAMEKRGRGDKFLLRAKSAKGINRSKLSAEYFSTYNQLKSLPENVRLLIAEKDERIRSLENMVEVALKRPGFYAKTYQHQGHIMPENTGININAGGNVGAVGGRDVINQGVINLDIINSDLANAINQLVDSPQNAQPEVIKLLNQLQAAINSENALKKEDKAEALEQLKVLTEMGKNPQEGARQKMGKTALNVLKGIVTGLPSAAKVVEACNTITKLLGLS